MTFRLPDNTQRTAIIGKTGSGKSQFAAWMLSHAPFHKMPYVIVDYKGDDLLQGIERAKQISLKDVPKHAGLYYLQPRIDEEKEVEAWLWKVWEKGRVGLHFDECYSLPNARTGSGAFRAILTQGRSKRIPALCCTQRPSWISPFIFSEAEFFALFHLHNPNDQDRVRELTSVDLRNRVPDYHSRWYDVGRDTVTRMLPVEDADTILERFHRRLTPRRHLL